MGATVSKPRALHIDVYSPNEIWLPVSLLFDKLFGYDSSNRAYSN